MTCYTDGTIDDALLGDIDGDSVVDLAIGVAGDDDGVEDAGAAYVIFLLRRNQRKHQKHSEDI